MHIPRQPQVVIIGAGLGGLWAACESNRERRGGKLTFTVIGGGATGGELTGALAGKTPLE